MCHAPHIFSALRISPSRHCFVMLLTWDGFGSPPKRHPANSTALITVSPLAFTFT